MVTRSNRTHKGPVVLPDGVKMENAADSANGISFENHAGVQDGSAVTLFGGRTPSGRAFIAERVSGVTATMEIDGVNSAVQEVDDPNTTFSPTSGTASSVNVYFDTSGFKAANNLDTGSAADFSVITME